MDAFSGDQTYKDKAFDVKLRLWEESYWMPQVSVGAKDIGGTGLFDAEKSNGPQALLATMYSASNRPVPPISLAPTETCGIQ